MAIEHVMKTMAKHWLDTGAPSMYGFWTLCGRVLGIPECYCTNLRWAYEEIIGAPKNTLGKKADPPMSDADQMRFCATRGDGAPGVPAAPTHPLDVPSPLSQRALSAAAIVASLAANAAAAAPAGAAPAVSGGGGTAAASASAVAPARKRLADDDIQALEERAAHSNRLCTDKAKEKAAADDAAQKAAEVARKAAVEAEAAAAVADKDRAALERAKEKREMKARAAKKIADAKAALEQALAEAAALE